MAAQQIINDSITCKTTGSGITATTRDIPVYLADSSGATEPTPTVGAADATNTAIYGKLEETIGPLGNPTGFDSTTPNQLEYTMGANVVIDGIVEFTKSSAAADTDIGLGVVGVANNQVDTAATGTGKVVAYNGTTIWVDLRA